MTMDVEAVVVQLECFIARRKNVSFVEIRQFLNEAGIETSGTLSIDLLPNLVLWAGMSEEFADVVQLMMKRRRVQLSSSLPLVYIADGGALNLPIAKTAPKRGYKKPHWAPVVFNPQEQPK